MAKIIFQDSFLVSGIMCAGTCRLAIQEACNNSLDTCKQMQLLPDNAQIIMDSDPEALGIHRLFISIEIERDDEELNLDALQKEHISAELKKGVQKAEFDVVDYQSNQENTPSNLNWINIIVNLISIGFVIAFSIIFPPSLLLTIGQTTLSFLTTAFTARGYLFNFFHNLRHRNFANMTTTITLGWLLSLAHTLYHAITMPLVIGFSMIFMSFIMPIVLITVINGMDEIKRVILNKSKKMHLAGIKTLFPQMADEYECYSLSQQKQDELSNRMQPILNPDMENTDDSIQLIQNILMNETVVVNKKNILKKGMTLQIKSGTCFPVDCILIQGNTLVDSSLLTGEPQQSKHPRDFIPAGAINLGESVTVYATQDSYNSTINKLLFRSNRAKKLITSEPNPTFTYLYTSLIILGIVASIVTPLAFGVLSIPLLLQHITGILFAICPCTIAIAHQLPNLLNLYQRGNKGIAIRNENVCEQTDDIHTVVFDKTGTLTTGHSQVESFDEGISLALWDRIYLLEKAYGAKHPLAKAINQYYETILKRHTMFTTLNDVSNDPKSRGLTGIVQGRQIHIGNSDYLQQFNIDVPPPNPHKIEQGFSPVYIAEDTLYQGIIYIKHEIRKDMLVSLTRLKNEGKKIIMLTGDSKESAIGFNQQNGAIFDLENIHAEQTPAKKDDFISNLMKSETINPKGVWFVGDGLNDAPCARMVSEKGGVSCAITSDEKASFFTDISLNGSLDYLFKHKKLNQFLKKNVLQNQGLLMYAAIASITLLIFFSMAGIALSPLIPLIIMVSTTLMVLFNSYRVQLATDNALDKNTSWLKQLLASDVSIGLLAGSSLLLIGSLLISTLATGALTLPIIIFTAGAMAAISSIFILTACTLLALFVLLTTCYLFFDRANQSQLDECDELSSQPPIKNNVGCLSIMEPNEEASNDVQLGLGVSVFNNKCADEPTHPIPQFF